MSVRCRLRRQGRASGEARRSRARGVRSASATVRCARCSTRRTARPRSRIAASARRRLDDARGKPERRLVEQQHVRLRDERARDRELLLLPAGERTGAAARGSRARAGNSSSTRATVVGEAVALAAGGEPEPRFSSTESSAKIRRPSGTSAMPRAHVLGPGRAATRPASRTSPPAARRSAHDGVQRRGLAGAVRADQPDDLAPPDARGRGPRTANGP